MPTLQSKNDVLGKKKYKWELVPCPEWGCDVTVREASAKDLDAFDEFRFPYNPETKKTTYNSKNAHAKFVAYCVVDDNGCRVFQDSDVESLGQESSVVVRRLYDVATRLSGMDMESEGEAEGNSEGGSTSGSPTSSQPTSAV